MVVVVRVDIGRVKKRREEQPLLLLWQKLDVSWWCCLRTVTAITGSGSTPSKMLQLFLNGTALVNLSYPILQNAAPKNSS